MRTYSPKQIRRMLDRYELMVLNQERQSRAADAYRGMSNGSKTLEAFADEEEALAKSYGLEAARFRGRMMAALSTVTEDV